LPQNDNCVVELRCVWQNACFAEAGTQNALVEESQEGNDAE